MPRSIARLTQTLKAMAPSNGSSIIEKVPLELSDAKWTTLQKIKWQDPSGKQRIWESAERVTNKNTTTGAVGIIALLKSPTAKTRIILEKQYRPPLDAICIEVPAGMIDQNESPSETAVRELREETGYTGTATRESYIFYNDPGFCNTTTYLCYVDVDLSSPQNKDVKPHLEEGEFIELFTPEIDGLSDLLSQLSKEGYAVDGRLAAFAEGLALQQ